MLSIYEFSVEFGTSTNVLSFTIALKVKLFFEITQLMTSYLLSLHFHFFKFLSHGHCPIRGDQTFLCRVSLGPESGNEPSPTKAWVNRYTVCIRVNGFEYLFVCNNASDELFFAIVLLVKRFLFNCASNDELPLTIIKLVIKHQLHN